MKIRKKKKEKKDPDAIDLYEILTKDSNGISVVARFYFNERIKDIEKKIDEMPDK